jgi:hypothetical protein
MMLFTLLLPLFLLGGLGQRRQRAGGAPVDPGAAV